MIRNLSNNTKIIIILSVSAILIVFSTNILPDLINDASTNTSEEYHYETTFPVGRPSELKSNEGTPIP